MTLTEHPLEACGEMDMEIERRLPVNFSLGRLFVYFTVISVGTGVMLRYPEMVAALYGGMGTVTVAALMVVSMVVPMVLVARANTRLFRRIELALFLTMTGAFLGAFFSPGWSANGESLVVWLLGLGRLRFQAFGLRDVIIPPVTAAIVGRLGALVLWMAGNPTKSTTT